MTRKWLGPVLIALALVGTLPFLDQLPERVPTHWNWQGEVDGTMAKVPGAFLGPLIGAGLWVLLPLLRRVDPRRRNYERFDETFWLLLNLLTVGMLILHVATIAYALGAGFEMSRAVFLAVGFLFAALGNYLPRLRSNWWMGIRTPWTLDSEEVWRRTHRLGGRTFVVGGVLCVLGALFLPARAAAALATAALLLAALLPVVYSFVLYRQLKRGDAPRGDAPL